MPEMGQTGHFGVAWCVQLHMLEWLVLDQLADCRSFGDLNVFDDFDGFDVFDGLTLHISQ